MQLSNEQRSWLRRGLESLASECHRSFEDALWLGFGDEWWPMREQLVRLDYVASKRDESVILTARGKQLLERLSSHVGVA